MSSYEEPMEFAILLTLRVEVYMQVVREFFTSSAVYVLIPVVVWIACSLFDEWMIKRKKNRENDEQGNSNRKD